jgi:replicative DNA helicase
MPDSIVALDGGRSVDSHGILASLVSGEAEQSLLGALLANVALFQSVPLDFRIEHLAISGHADIFRAICVAAEQVPNGPVILQASNALAADRDLRSYVTGLVGAAVAFTPDHVKACAAMISDLWRRRELIGAMDDVRADLAGERGIPAAAVIAQHQARLEALAVGAEQRGHAVMLGDALDRALAHADAAAKNGGPSGLSTGMASVDDVMGGMEPGHLLVLAGRPGSGKSSLGLQWAVNIARQQIGVLTISLEMSAMALGRRVLSAASGVPISRMRRGEHEPYAVRLLEAKRELHGLPMSIEDGGGMNAADIALKCRMARRRHGLGLIVVDHLHIVRPDADVMRAGGPTQAVAQIAHAMQALAKAENCPVLLLAQLNRSVEGRDDKRPTIADLRQSGAIEEDADVVSFVYRPEMYMKDTPPERAEGEHGERYETRVRAYYDQKERVAGVAELIFDKVRDGERTTVPLRFDGPTASFSEVTHNG